MRLLRTLLGRKKPATAGPSPVPSDSLPHPDQTMFVIGDIHGRLDLLEQLMELIDAAIGKDGIEDPKLVFVGDIVDRGPQSQQVLKRVFELATEFPENVVCLLGNHEQMMLDFLDAPVARQARWLRNGGVQTMESFGIDVPEDLGAVEHAQSLADTLKGALEPDLLHWLGELPVKLSSGNLHVVHAGIDPGRAISDQSARVLVWGHPEFLSRERGDGQWIAHGHTVMDDPIYDKGRISVDTGAWNSGILTTAMVSPDGSVKFLSTL